MKENEYQTNKKSFIEFVKKNDLNEQNIYDALYNFGRIKSYLDILAPLLSEIEESNEKMIIPEEEKRLFKELDCQFMDIIVYLHKITLELVADNKKTLVLNEKLEKSIDVWMKTFEQFTVPRKNVIDLYGLL